MSDKSKQHLIQALIEEASNYYIDVLDNTMLPDNLKEKKEIHFEIKPPTIYTMSKCALSALKIPEELRDKDIKDIKLEEIIKYSEEIVEIISIFAHGSKKGDYPKWNIPFLLKNLDPKDLYKIYIETSLKLQSGFFLNSFQNASQNNPMMMKKVKDSILTNS